ncbi:tetratricopeptide repeat protein [Thiocystis violacea]|uniref:tetratricopeptide repeat protein n=1 Tax=Thiocystis violacea TaxID=13725 RepID=UPI0019082735|nr:tetratricopeptide repeat protein [Thiocystis violacea]MBK1720751.1 hypothetical protein [Thiocystis violacea]
MKLSSAISHHWPCQPALGMGRSSARTPQKRRSAGAFAPRIALSGILLALALAALPPALNAASPGLSAATHARLAEVQTLMASRDYPRASRQLDALAAEVRGDAYAQAMVLQTYAYLYRAQGEPAKAMDALTRCLALDVLPRAVSQDLRYLLAQLQLNADDSQGAADSLDLWLRVEKSPKAEAFALAGMANARLGRYRRAADLLEQALSRQRTPPEDWQRQLLAVYLTEGRYAPAAQVLTRLIAANPNSKADLLQLAAIDTKLGDQRGALAALELARRQGLLDQPAELSDLAGRYLRLGMPLRAAQLLETAIADGDLPSTREHWERLSDAWLRAKELRRARAALGHALESDADPALQLRRARLAVEAEDWPEVLAAVGAALQSPGFDQPGRAHLLAGMAHDGRREPDAARADFERAAGFPDTREDARGWLAHLDAVAEAADSAAKDR